MCIRKYIHLQEGTYFNFVSSQSLLSMETAKEKENKRVNEEILELLTKPTAKVSCCW